MNIKLPDAAKVREPIALIALLGVITIVLILATVENFAFWPFLTISGFAFVGLIALMLFPRFRDVLTDNATWLKLRELRHRFDNFAPDVGQRPSGPGDAPAQATAVPGLPVPTVASIAKHLEERRVFIYEQNRGLFLTHTWRPSVVTGQVADIVVSLRQHGSGPLTQGSVECVEYWLGPKFSNQPEVKTKEDPSFDLDLTAYSPALCIARVTLTDQVTPLELSRYLDF
jgi:hypothetical protein